MTKLDPKPFQLLVDAGFTLIPLRGKQPRDKGWTSRDYCNDKTLADAAKTGCNIGVRLEPHHLVIDVDPRNGGNSSLPRLSEALGVDLSEWTPATHTGSGGLHLWMRVDPEAKLAGKLKGYPGIDVRKVGNQVVAPGSIHPDTGKPYVLDDPFCDLADLPLAPEKLSAMLGRVSTKDTGTESLGGSIGEPVLSADQIATLLPMVEIPGGQGLYEDWLAFVMGCHAASDGDPAVLTELEEWSDIDANLEARWEGFAARPDGVGFGTVARLAMEHAIEGKAGDVEAWVREVRAASSFSDADDPEVEAFTTKEKERPRIRLAEGRQAAIVAEATEVLMEALGGAILQQNGGLVRPVVLDATKDIEGVVRISAGTTVLMPVATNWLWLKLSQVADWYRVTRQTEEKGGGTKATRTDPPKKIAQLIEDNVGELPFHHVRAMVTAPTVDVRTGAIIDQPGINPQTGLLAVFDPHQFRQVRRGLSQEQAKANLEQVFQDLLRGFPFDDGPKGGSAAVAMSCLVSALLRPTMRTCPLHAIDAAAPGTGKTKLAELAGILAMGSKPAASAWARDEEENEKRFGASLLQRTPVLLLDNLEAKNGDKIEGNMLNMMLTSETVSIRVLGQHLKANLSTKVFVVATGNNLVVAGDMVRRVVKARMDAKMAQPETRVFEWDPVDVAMEHRGEIVASILEAVAAYIEAGRPCDNQVAPVGSFEDWRLVQGLLTWCGWTDPAKTVADVRASDTSRNQLQEALTTWNACFGGEWVVADELAGLITSAQDFNQPDCADTFEHFEEVDNLVTQLLNGKTTSAWIGREMRALTGLSCGEFYLEVTSAGRSVKARLT